MSDFVEQLKLAEKAAEDIYFAKINCALIESLHKRMQAEKNTFQPSDQTNAEARMGNSQVVMKETGSGQPGTNISGPRSLLGHRFVCEWTSPKAEIQRI